MFETFNRKKHQEQKDSNANEFIKTDESNYNPVRSIRKPPQHSQKHEAAPAVDDSQSIRKVQSTAELDGESGAEDGKIKRKKKTSRHRRTASLFNIDEINP